MKDLLLFIAVAGLLLAGGCGDGDSGSTTPATAPFNASTQTNSSVSSDPQNTAVSSVVAVPSIDPPSPPIAMSAAVTETIDAPRPASALAQIPTASGDMSAATITQQVSPVIHYPPDTTTGSDE